METAVLRQFFIFWRRSDNFLMKRLFFIFTAPLPE